MSSIINTDNNITNIFQFLKDNKWVGLRWDFLNGEPCIVAEYIPFKYIHEANSKSNLDINTDIIKYKFDVWPDSPLYHPVCNLNYKKLDVVKKAYEFLKNKVYIGSYNIEKWILAEEVFDWDDITIIDDQKFVKKTLVIHCYVLKDNIYQRDFKKYIIKVHPDDEEYDYTNFHNVNCPQIRPHYELN